MGTSLNGLTPAGTYPGLIKTGDNAPIDGTLKTLSDGNGNNLPMTVSTTAVNFTNQLQQGGVAVPTASQVNAKQDTLVSGTNIKTINGTSLLGSGNIPVVTSPSGVAGAIQFSNGSAFASDAANLFWDDTNNRLGVGTNAPATALDIQGADNAFFARFGTVSGDFRIKPFLNATYGTYIESRYANETFMPLSIGASRLFAFTPVSIGTDSTSAMLQVQGSGSTSATTSLLVQNSVGTQTFKVADDGVATTSTLLINNTLSFNSADYGSLGLFAAGVWNFNGGGINDTPRINWGGYTSLFPSLKRNGTAIDVRLADDSNYAGFNTGATTIKGSGSTIATTSLLVQNSGGTEAFRIRDNANATFGADVTVTGALNVTQDVALQNTVLYWGGGYQIRNTANGFVFTGSGGSATGALGLGMTSGTGINASAILQADSTTKGFLPPRMTTTEKNAIATPAAGLVVYDSTTNKLCCYNGSTWNDLF